MNRHHLFASLLVLSCSLPACMTTEGYEQASDTAGEIIGVGEAAGRTQMRIDDTLSALESVVEAAERNPKPAFDTFARQFAAVGGEIAGLTRARQDLEKKAERWFAEYTRRNDSIADEDLREAGLKRLGEFRQQVANVSAEVTELSADTSALEARLRDLRTFLGNDLTPRGIDLVAGRVDDVAEDGRKVAAELGRLSKRSEELANRMRAAQEPAGT